MRGPISRNVDNCRWSNSVEIGVLNESNFADVKCFNVFETKCCKRRGVRQFRLFEGSSAVKSKHAVAEIAVLDLLGGFQRLFWSPIGS